MRRSGANNTRAGWVKAPPVVEAEIRAVWQEDELPDEITKAAGYRPFTLGVDAQAWVDSMAEVVDGGKAVYGRPRPVAPAQRRQLATPPPAYRNPPQAVPQPSWTPPPYVPPAPAQPRVLMPDIDEPSPPHAKPIPMPDIDGGRPPPTPRVLIPEIDEPSRPHTLMPDIDDAPPPRPRTLPKRVLMPDIGEEPSPRDQPPGMPEIG